MKSKEFQRSNRRARGIAAAGENVLPAELPSWITLVLLPGLLVLAAVFLAVHPITDPDFWYHAAFGRQLASTDAIPQTDIFSYTANGHPWISSGWLSAYTLHILYKNAGPAGPIVFAWVCVAAASLLTYTFARKYKAPVASAILILIALLASYPRFNPRPDIVSQFMIVPLILLLVHSERKIQQDPSADSRELWLLPIFFIFWANLHALFFLGLMVVTFYALWGITLWRKSRNRHHLHALLPCALCFVTWLANPYGGRLLQFVYDNATLPHIGTRVYELKPLLNAESLRGGLPIHILLSIAALLVVTAICWWKNRGTIAGWRTLALAAVVFLLFYQRRQIGLAGAAIPALLVADLGSLELTLRRRRSVALALPIALTALICGMRIIGLLEISPGLPRAGVDNAWFPVGAAKFLRANPAPPKMFHDLYTGGYLLHELGPEQKVFIDGRLELYKDGPWQDYFAPPEKRMTVDQLFRKYGVQTAVLDIRGARDNPGHVANQLSARPDWLPVYFDDQYCVLVQETSATKSYVSQHGFHFANPLDWTRMGTATDTATRQTALHEANRSLQLAPGSAAANTAMALANYNLGNRSDGDLYLKKAQQIDPSIQLSQK